MITLWKLWLKNGGLCFYCGVRTTVGKHKNQNPTKKYKNEFIDKEEFEKRRATRDHYIAKCYGGGNDKDNLVLACITCNRSKQDKLPWQLKR